MSIISIAVGRCGLGLHSALTEYTSDYLKILEKRSNSCDENGIGNRLAYADTVRSLYFREKNDSNKEHLVPRTVVIGSDMFGLEGFCNNNLCSRLREKVYGSQQHDETSGDQDISSGWSYDEAYTMHLDEPSYGLWSNGFNGTSSKEETLSECLRKSTEDADSVNGFTSFGSLGGGTGSGAGSFVSRFISDHYPKVTHLTTAVIPFIQGESGMQAINLTLALGNYQECCDGILLLANDMQRDICEKIFGENINGLDAFNEAYAMHLFHSMRPNSSTAPLSGASRFERPLDYITDGLCSYPTLKMLNLDMLPLVRLAEASHGYVGLQQMVTQLGDDLNAAPFFRDHLVNEKVSTISNDVKVNVKSDGHATNNSSHHKIIIQDYVGHRVTNVTNDKPVRNYSPSPYCPVISPATTLKFSERGMHICNSFNRNMKSASSEGFKIIKRLGKHRSIVAKYNVVVSLQLNIGGPLLESLNLADFYQDVLFWQHSARPIQVSYCPEDVGLFGSSVSQISNSQTQMPLIDFAFNTASMAYSTNTYIHKYIEAGLERDEIKEGLTKVKSILSSYAYLSA